MKASSDVRSFRSPRLRFAADMERARAEAAVVWVATDGDRPRALSPFPAATRDMVAAWLKERHVFKGEEGEVAILPGVSEGGPQRVALAGVGEFRRIEPWRIERAAAAAAKALAAHHPRAIAWPLEIEPASLRSDPARLARHVACGATEGPYRFQRFHSKPTPRAPSEMVLVGASGGDGAVRRAAEEGAIEGATLNEVAELANLPANEATPTVLASRARRLAHAAGLSCRVYDAADLRRERCHALLAVAAGSRQAPRLILLQYAGTRRGARPIALVGKTLTFDAGGLSLKPAMNMEWMRYDKCGGMAVLATVLTASRLRFPHPVVGLLAAAENLPDGGAARPGDIVRARSGRTIEIVNTDAEGRLVLADALSIAADFRPAIMVDVATLTGAARIALGEQASALCSPDESLATALMEAGRRSGDRVWPLPLWPEYDKMLETPFADIKNSGDGSAGTIAGAAFLRAFVPEGMPWAHLDIAARAWIEKEQPHRYPGATMAGARLLIEWLRTLTPQ